MAEISDPIKINGVPRSVINKAKKLAKNNICKIPCEHISGVSIGDDIMIIVLNGDEDIPGHSLRGVVQKITWWNVIIELARNT